MADPHPHQGAARLSQDIGDVLGAIRRLIAKDDQALGAVTQAAVPDPLLLTQDDRTAAASIEGGQARHDAEADMTLTTTAARSGWTSDHGVLESVPIQRPFSPTRIAVHDTGSDDDDDFAEAFAWKARNAPPARKAAVTARVPLAPPAIRELEAASVTRDTIDPMLRSLLREMILEELHGEMGACFSANIREIVRREVATALEIYVDLI